MPYYVWVPLTICVYFFSALFTYKNNTSSGYMWFVITWVAGMVPLWSFISKHSKNLVFDGLLYDTVMVVSYTMFIMLFTKEFGRLSLTNYAGLGLIFIGLFLFKR